MSDDDQPVRSSYYRDQALLNLIVALKPEADPIISALGLKKTPAAFPLYQSKEYSLVISGIGKCRSAAATAWLSARQYDKNENSSLQDKRVSLGMCWLNVGIAGHIDSPIGANYLAHTVRDASSNRVWFPPLIKCTTPASALLTVDRPLCNYSPDNLYDMEASGFIETARIFSHSELVQCFKVVSDNSSHPFTEVTPDKTAKLMADSMETIITVIQNLQQLQSVIYQHKSHCSVEFIQRWKFSKSQEVQLERLLQRYSTIHIPLTEIPAELLNVKKAKDVLHWLQTSVDQVKYFL